MRNLFFARSVPSGSEWKEIVWAVVIMVVAYYAAYFMAVLLIRMGYPLVAALEGAAMGISVAAFIVFSSIRFSPFTAFGIGLGVYLTQRGISLRDEWVWLLETGGGFWLILRCFSIGPVRGSMRSPKK